MPPQENVFFEGCGVRKLFPEVFEGVVLQNTNPENHEAFQDLPDNPRLQGDPTSNPNGTYLLNGIFIVNKIVRKVTTNSRFAFLRPDLYVIHCIVQLRWEAVVCGCVGKNLSELHVILLRRDSEATSLGGTSLPSRKFSNLNWQENNHEDRSF